MRPLFILPSVCAVIYTSVMLVCAGISFAIPQAKTEQQRDERSTLSASRKGSLVRGRVIYEDTRRPLRRVQVMIYDPANREGRGRHLRSWTNARGEFQLKDVPEGKYFISVDAPGIIRSQPFDSSDSQTDLTSVTVDGTSQSDVVVRVKRGGAVSGKVTYADGDRVSGLSPGDYLIGAAEEKMGIELMAQEEVDGSVMLNRARFPATYYGGAVSLKGATVLHVEAGDEKADINITLVERSVYSISGVVMLKGDQRPIARARVSLKKKDEEPDSLRGEDLVVNADEEGRFTFDEAPEGAYMMTVTPPRENYRSYTVDAPAPGPKTDPIQKFAAKNLELNVAGDVTGLVVEVSSGSRLSGVLTVRRKQQN